MRIVQISAYPLSSECIRGGVEASVYGLSQELGKTHEVHVFDQPRIGGSWGIGQDGTVIVHRFQNTCKNQFQAVHQVKSMAKDICELGPDICHIHGTGLFQWMMYRSLRRKKQHVVVTVHGLIYVEKKNQLKKGFSIKRLLQCIYQGWSEKRLLSQLPVAIVDTEYVKEKLLHYPMMWKKPDMYVIPQGVHEDFFSAKCSDTSSVFLSVGAMSERKGHLHTLKAFEQVRDKGVFAQLVIAGALADMGYFDKMKKAVDQSRYRKDIKLCPNIGYNALKDLYASAHVFVLHSEEESQGIVFVEAMAMGLPVVATSVGGVPFVVKQGEMGLLSVFADIDVFSNNMYLLMQDEKLWVKLSHAAKEHAQSFHWGVIKNKVLAVYSQII